MINSLTYISFLKFNNLKKNKSLFTVNLFLKKNLKKSFKFFFKNIIMFLYKFSLIKHKKNKFIKLLTKKTKKVYKKSHINYRNRKKGLKLIAFIRKNKLFSQKKNKFIQMRKLLKLSYYQYKKKSRKLKRKKKHQLRMISQKEKKIARRLRKRNRNNLYECKRLNKFKEKKDKKFEKIVLEKQNQEMLNKKLNQNIKKKKINLNKKKKKFNLIKKKKKINLIKFDLIQQDQIQLLKKNRKRLKKNLKKSKKKKKIKKQIKNEFVKFFKKSLIKKKQFNLYTFKKLFFRKTLVKRIYELSFKNDLQLKNAANILKNNKKFKFLTFPINSICKFFFKKSMYNIFMTLVVFPNNLTIGNYSGGHFNILSKRRDRGSINSLKSMSKLISLKIYQSNLSFIIFCPRLFTNQNKRLIKTIFYSFKILNRSPITKIYLYRPVIRNGIRSKKIPRK